MRNRKYISDILNDLPSGPPNDGGARQRGPIWPLSWFDPVLSNERFGRWERAELRARFSEHPPSEVAAWLVQAATDITNLDVATAVDRLVEHMYPNSRREKDAVRDAPHNTSADRSEADDSFSVTPLKGGAQDVG